MGGAVRGKGLGRQQQRTALQSTAAGATPRLHDGEFAAWTVARFEKEAFRASMPQGLWRVQRNIDGCVVVVLEKKKLVSVKTRLEKSFW